MVHELVLLGGLPLSASAGISGCSAAGTGAARARVMIASMSTLRAKCIRLRTVRTRRSCWICVADVLLPQHARNIYMIPRTPKFACPKLRHFVTPDGVPAPAQNTITCRVVCPRLAQALWQWLAGRAFSLLSSAPAYNKVWMQMRAAEREGR